MPGSVCLLAILLAKSLGRFTCYKHVSAEQRARSACVKAALSLTISIFLFLRCVLYSANLANLYTILSRCFGGVVSKVRKWGNIFVSLLQKDIPHTSVTVLLSVTFKFTLLQLASSRLCWVPQQISAATDGPARCAASRSSLCTQRWTISVINWRR